MSEQFWTGKTALVAGPTGFLGGWLVRRLLESGASVVALVRSLNRESQFVLTDQGARCAVEYGDVSDAKRIELIFQKYDIDVFFHTAAEADVAKVLDHPVDCFRSAALSTWQILDFLRKEQSKCVSIISSTDKVYGRQPLPYRESSALQPLHPYEIAKASQDLCAQSYGKVFGCPVAVTRCGNYFGAFDFNYQRLIPGVIRSILSGAQPILRSSGRYTRDFLYIEDAVDVQLMLAEQLTGNPSLYGEAFNFSYGEQIEVLDVVRRICEILDYRQGPKIINSTVSEIQLMELSSEKAIDVLGWRPKYGFQEGLERTIDWYSGYFSERAR